MLLTHQRLTLPRRGKDAKRIDHVLCLYCPLGRTQVSCSVDVGGGDDDPMAQWAGGVLAEELGKEVSRARPRRIWRTEASNPRDLGYSTLPGQPGSSLNLIAQEFLSKFHHITMTDWPSTVELNHQPDSLPWRWGVCRESSKAPITRRSAPILKLPGALQ